MRGWLEFIFDTLGYEVDHCIEKHQFGFALRFFIMNFYITDKFIDLVSILMNSVKHNARPLPPEVNKKKFRVFEALVDTGDAIPDIIKNRQLEHIHALRIHAR
ncbi:hypothetical protein TrCOL_g10842 [Triparma columacea]|nr:hypothetical protein TrCOL_g10842 [Triparma columacea]